MSQLIISLYQFFSILFFFLFLNPLVVISSFSSNVSDSPKKHCHHEHSTALLQFKHIFSINPSASYDCNDSHAKISFWNENTDCCLWDGVTCDMPTGHVISLDLSCSQLQGTIHSKNITTLFPLTHHLQRLNLAYNDFSLSPISSHFGQFSSLKYLNLSRSNFSGHIPFEISHLTKLISLDLSNNYYYDASEFFVSPLELNMFSLKNIVQNLTQLMQLDLSIVNMSSVEVGTLRNLSSSTLTLLNLRSCGLRGKFPPNIFHLPNLLQLTHSDLSNNYNLDVEIPSSLSNLGQLNYLDLSYNNFGGVIPAWLGNLTNLSTLILGDNNFSGLIPTSLSMLKQLTVLDLSENNLSGVIPAWLGNFTQLSTLKLWSNNFSGLIPTSLSMLKQLTVLDLLENNLEGSIPASLGKLVQISYLDLSHNNLIGQIPSSFSKLETLSYLDLSDNHFSGLIPAWIGNLTNVSELELSSNNFSGEIPCSLAKLEKVTSWYLSNNQLSGLIPASIGNLTQISWLDLSNNHLIGLIPAWLSNLTRINKLDLSNNHFIGLIPAWLSNLTRIYYLGLSNNHFIGLIPASLGNLTGMEYLYLSNNHLIGSIPAFLGNLTEIWNLDLSFNNFSGEIPSSLLRLHQLRYLNLSLNHFSGHFFSSGVEQLPWKDLQSLDLHSNMLQGPLPVPPPSNKYLLISNNKFSGKIPHSICNANSLVVLDLSNNNLSGMIPQCLGNFSNSLSVLDLRKNYFHGTIPRTFGKGNSLRTLQFDGNQFEGPIPKSLTECKNLEVLDLGNNEINDTFPNWLDTLPNLQVLVLRSNRFHGPIGTSKTRFIFSKLRIIDLSHNEFNGLLPKKYFSTWNAMMNVYKENTKLAYMGENYYQDSVMVTVKGFDIKLEKILTIYTTLDFSNNKFQGEIPKSIGKLTSLRLLNFSCNNLTSHIPLTLENLKNLESLDLSSNNLTGEIPEQLTSLTFLAFLNLSQNHLVGLIPRGNQFDTFANSSYKENLGLCGLPLSKSCNNNDSPQPPPLIQKEDNSEFCGGFGWKAVLMGYGFGMVIGLAWGYYILSRNPYWFAIIVEKVRHKIVKGPKNSTQRRERRRN